MAVKTFSELGLSIELVSALAQQGWQQPTPIQSAAIPVALSGRDVLAAAQTGTGKTGAFLLPSIQRIQPHASPSTSPARHPTRIVVLTPTRELADQIYQDLQLFLCHLPLQSTALLGGVPIELQKRALQAGCDIVVATVGRFLDHVQQRSIQLQHVEVVILDEADQMLDMGFIADIRTIMQTLEHRRQTLLFSATFSPAVRALAQQFLHDPAEISTTFDNATADTVEQHFIAIDLARKPELLRQIITDLGEQQELVFGKTKQGVSNIAKSLHRYRIQASAIHGDRSQQERLQVLRQFKDGALQVLVATDVAARGLDIHQLPFVINYDLPHQLENYVHRIGRVGRAGAQGTAISLVDEHEQGHLDALRELLNQPIDLKRIEGFEPVWFNVHPPTKPTSAKCADVATACTRIAGRKRRQKPMCALLLPRYGLPAGQ